MSAPMTASSVLPHDISSTGLTSGGIRKRMFSTRSGRRQHLGLVAWIREPTGGGQDLLILEQAAGVLAQRAGSPASLGAAGCWCWKARRGSGKPRSLTT